MDWLGIEPLNRVPAQHLYQTGLPHLLPMPLSVCLSVFSHDVSKTDAAKITKLNTKYSSTSPRSPLILGSTGQRSRSQEHCRRGSLHSCECRLLLIDAALLKSYDVRWWQWQESEWIDCSWWEQRQPGSDRREHRRKQICTTFQTVCTCPTVRIITKYKMNFDAPSSKWTSSPQNTLIKVWNIFIFIHAKWYKEI